MKRWHSLYDGMTSSLKYLLVLTILIGTLRALAIPIISSVVRVETIFLLRLLEIFRITLVFLLQLFPFVVLVSLVQRKLKHSGAVVASIISGIILYAMTLIIPLTQLSSQYTFPLFNLTLPSPNFIGQPIQLGLAMTFIAYQIVKNSIRISKRNIPYGLIGFVDSDTWVILYTLLFSIGIGYGLTIGWPWFISAIEVIMRFIAQDITNPINIFLYSLLEHALIIVNLQSILHANFWFSSMGGSWINSTGTLFVGDINIWVEQFSLGIVPIGVGRFTSGWYIVNMFLVPSILWIMYFQFSNKFDTRRFRNMFILLTLVSIVIGFRIPFEIFLVLAAPLLYVFYVLLTSVVYAVVVALGVNIGPILNSGLNYPLPGKGVYTFIYLRNPQLSERVWLLFIIGSIAMLIMGVIAHLYYKYLAIDFITVGNKQKSVEQIEYVMGGLENIRMIHSSFSRIYILPYDKTKVDFERTSILNVSQVIENKNGYNLNFGAASNIIRRIIMRRLIEYKEKELMNKVTES